LSWRKFWKSALVEALENEIAYLRNEIAEMKKAHTEELNRVRTYSDRLSDELQRTRILLSPGLSAVSLPHEHEDSSTMEEVKFHGTPWMRVQKQMEEEDEKRWREACAARESKDGDVQQRRDETPFRVEGPTAR